MYQRLSDEKIHMEPKDSKLTYEDLTIKNIDNNTLPVNKMINESNMYLLSTELSYFN